MTAFHGWTVLYEAPFEVSRHLERSLAAFVRLGTLWHRPRLDIVQ